MADIAIDPTDIRSPSTSGDAAKPRLGRKAVFIAGGVAFGMAAIGGAAATIISHFKFPSNLSGLAFLPKPEAPRRTEIRIGRLPDMPEIRDGVPALVGTKPVRVVETQPPAAPANSGPRTVAASVVPAATLPAAPLPTTFTGAGSPQLISTIATPVVSSTRLETSSGPLLGSAVAPRAPATPAPSPVLVRDADPKPAAPAPIARAEPGAVSEPAATASVSAAVPLPPVRAAARIPEKLVSRPAQVAARQPSQPITPSPTEAASPPAPPPDDRMEILGVKVPNGSDLKKAVSSIGEVLNLPKAF